MLDSRAFITGITGQDGSYLAELLLAKGYFVHGLIQRPKTLAVSNISHLVADEGIFNKRLFLHVGSLEDPIYLRKVIARTRPQEVYHLAAQSSPRLSLELPESTVNSIGIGTLRLLEISRDLPDPPRLLLASSSEVFGIAACSPQDESTPVEPATPYGAAKAMAQHLVRIYRTAHGLPACSAILYNHESPRRGDDFVTIKIARAAARIRKGLQQQLELGSLTGRRDWGWAPDYVRAMWLMLQRGAPEDFVLATGELHSVEEFVARAFDCVGLAWRNYVRHDPALVNASEPTAPRGNPDKARRLLGWSNTVTFDDIVARMVESEIRKLT